MRIHLVFDDEDTVLPCTCKILPVIKTFPGATVVIDPQGIGRAWAEKLQRYGVTIEIGSSDGR